MQGSDTNDLYQSPSTMIFTKAFARLADDFVCPLTPHLHYDIGSLRFDSEKNQCTHDCTCTYSCCISLLDDDTVTCAKDVCNIFGKIEIVGTDLGLFGDDFGMVRGSFRDDFGPSSKSRKFESSELKK